MEMVAVMSADEARECVERIKHGVREIRLELRRLYQGRGWAALGYVSWRECAVAEFGKSQRRVYQELAAAEVEERLCTIVQTEAIPESHLRPLTSLVPDDQPIAWQRAVETLPEGERMTAAHVSRVVQSMTEGEVLPQAAPPFALMSTESKEWYTPAAYIEAAREVMGGIDLDPASSDVANRVVKAAAFYTSDDDGMSAEWHGRVWLNPPYGSEDGEAESNQARWSRRLIDEYRAYRVTEAVLLVNATPSNAWWSPLWDFAICFTNRRIRFFLPSGEQAKQPTHSNALVYLGPNIDEFDRVFSRLGVVAIRRSFWGRRDA